METTNVVIAIVNVLITGTLLYLNYKYIRLVINQLNDNKKDIKTSKLTNTTDQFFKLVEMIIKNPELSMLFEGHPNFNIDHNDHDSVRKRWYMILRFSSWELIYLQYKEGIISKDDMNVWLHFMLSTLKHCPDWYALWKETQKDWDGEFCRYIFSKLSGNTNFI